MVKSLTIADVTLCAMRSALSDTVTFALTISEDELL
jgi:hypothetical protein